MIENGNMIGGASVQQGSEIVHEMELSELSLQDLQQGEGDGFNSLRTAGSVDGELQGGEEEREVVPGNSGLVGAGFNFVNSIVGAGIIGLAFALQECGFFMGLFFLFFVAYLTYYSVNILVASGIKVNRRNYEDLCDFCFGYWGFYAVSFFMAIFAFGAMCAYLVIVGDTIPVVVTHLFGFELNRQLGVFLFSTIIILPLCLLRDMAKLAWSSSVSITADALIVLLVIIRAKPGREEWTGDTIIVSYPFVNPSLFAGLGAISFAYVCQHSSFIVFNTLKSPTMNNWRRVNYFSIMAALVLSLLLALAGYLTFYNQTKANILNNFPCDDTAINVARLLLALTMVFTFPMEQFVARHSLYAVISGHSAELEGDRQMPLKWHIGLTLILWSLALLVGLTVTDLAVVLEFTGAFSASVLGYILPSICFFRVNSFRQLFHNAINCCKKGSPEYQATCIDRLRRFRDFFFPIFMIIFGFVAMIIGSYSAFHSTSKVAGSHQCMKSPSN